MFVFETMLAELGMHGDTLTYTRQVIVGILGGGNRIESCNAGGGLYVKSAKPRLNF